MIIQIITKSSSWLNCEEDDCCLCCQLHVLSHKGRFGLTFAYERTLKLNNMENISVVWNHWDAIIEQKTTWLCRVVNIHCRNTLVRSIFNQSIRSIFSTTDETHLWKTCPHHGRSGSISHASLFFLCSFHFLSFYFHGQFHVCLQYQM